MEELTKAIFRSGFSWRVVRDKWDNFRRSFDGFDVGSFHAYLRYLDDLEYHARVRVLTRQFKNLGHTGAFVSLHSVNEETPSWHDR